ncbi:hypothetical protein [Aliarcobacter cryaerophilus]|uniref:hypothetical protein n=1 Tax=Aliarcobacter cryaerophilus TaxID=28198 RepID=UPI0021B69C21|nr:hypothetical protein [Aliarcobacter cryaerophilus]MCT7531222.1 hypothetical protein [Aliarcobacter cryaerophilus]
MEITNTIFETLLKKNNFKKKEFSDYSKIPYDTVVGWKKKEYVPPYAIAILKDMNYRKKLDEETEKLLKRNLQPMVNQNHNLTKNEENRLKSLFCGTNFTIDDILKGIKDKNKKVMKKLEENI